MAKRRRYGNLLALAVLATLIQRPMHPYEMAAVMREQNKDHDMKIKWGSLYTVVQSLEKDSMIEVVGSERQGARPERTIYRITDLGRAHVEDWVRELVSVPERDHPRFEAALSVLAILSPDEAAFLLEQRLSLLEEEIARQRESLSEYRRDTPRLFLIELEYDLAIRGAEAGWIRSLLDEFTTESLPGLAEWRAYHATGVIPAAEAEAAADG